MKPHVIAACAALLVAAMPARADDMADKYFAKGNPKLTAQERAALAIGNRWAASAATGMAPVPGPNGLVQFVYGAQQASVVCAVLQGCDIALQPGEVLTGKPHMGDNGRWSLDASIEGVAPGEVVHLVVKPFDVNLETTLFVFTDRRRYYIKLRSHRSENMAMVAFRYPDDENAKLNALLARQHKLERQERQDRTIPSTGEYLGDLSFDYDFDNGPKQMRPLRVYSDGHKTVVEMQPGIANTELPSLVVLRKEGGILSDDQSDRINARFKNGRYTVDAVFDKAILIVGVGRDQERVTITRGKQ